MKLQWITISTISVFLTSANALAAVPKAGAKLNLEIPPIWDQGTRTFYTPKHIPVQNPNTGEICYFPGGAVTIKKVEPARVIFERAGSTSADPCRSLSTTAENIAQWNPKEVQAQKQKYSTLSEAFRKQLDNDVQGILQKKEVCKPLGSELNVGEKYRMDGNVFWYGPSSEARKVSAKGEVAEACHVEKNGTIQVLGFDRTQTFVIASYQAPAGSSGKVQTSSRTQSEACKTGENVVLLVNKVGSQFKYAAENPDKDLLEKVAAVFKIGTSDKSVPSCGASSGTEVGMITSTIGSAKTSVPTKDEGKSGEASGAKSAD